MITNKFNAQLLGGGVLEKVCFKGHYIPENLTWIPKIMGWKRELPLNMAIVGIYANFLGCRYRIWMIFQGIGVEETKKVPLNEV